MDDVRSYEDLFAIALEKVKRLPKPVSLVCGPISTGGQGSIGENLKVFNVVIKKLIADGHSIFDQVPFEEPMQRLKEMSGLETKAANQDLLDRFYLPLYKSGEIEKLFFIPGWESSHGATWERNLAQELGLQIVDLHQDFLH